MDMVLPTAEVVSCRGPGLPTHLVEQLGWLCEFSISEERSKELEQIHQQLSIHAPALPEQNILITSLVQVVWHRDNSLFTTDVESFNILHGWVWFYKG